MVGPHQKRAAVAHVMSKLAISEHRACRIVGMPRCTPGATGDADARGSGRWAALLVLHLCPRPSPLGMPSYPCARGHRRVASESQEDTTVVAWRGPWVDQGPQGGVPMAQAGR